MAYTKGIPGGGGFGKGGKGSGGGGKKPALTVIKGGKVKKKDEKKKDEKKKDEKKKDENKKVVKIEDHGGGFGLQKDGTFTLNPEAFKPAPLTHRVKTKLKSPESKAVGLVGSGVLLAEGVRKGKEYFASDDKRDYNKNKTSHVLTKKDKNKKGK